MDRKVLISKSKDLIRIKENEGTQNNSSLRSRTFNDCIPVSRTSSDPLKKSLIKRRPAFRCDRSAISECNSVNMQSSVSNRIKRFERNKSSSESDTVKLLSNPSSPNPNSFKSIQAQINKELTVSLNKPRKSIDNQNGPKQTNYLITTASPKYAQVIKPKRNINKTAVSPENGSGYVSQDSTENLTDTLKRVLRSPLPRGPPPLKPPRTFAHLSNNVKKIYESASNSSANKITSNDATVNRRFMRSKTDPKIMLNKLEEALNHKKINPVICSSVKPHRKIIRPDFGQQSSTVGRKSDPENYSFLELQKKMSRTIEDNNKSKHSISFNGCLPFSCSNGVYAERVPMKSKCEFSVSDLQNRPHHIYTEPFSHLKNDLSKKNNNEVKSQHNLQESNICPENKDLHYMCSPVQSVGSLYEEVKCALKFNLSEKGSSNSQNFEKKSTTYGHNDLIFEEQVNLDSLSLNTNTDSDFESTDSTSTVDDLAETMHNIDINETYNLNRLSSSSAKIQELKKKFENEESNKNQIDSNKITTGVLRNETTNNKKNLHAVLKPTLVIHNENVKTLQKKFETGEVNIKNHSNQFKKYRSKIQFAPLEEKKKKFESEHSEEISRERKQYVKRVTSTVKKYAKPGVQCAQKLFKCCLLASVNISDRTSFVKMQFPDNAPLPEGIEYLCFPDANSPKWADFTIDDHDNESNQNYSFVLTNENGERGYCYCRRVLPEEDSHCLPLAYCIITMHRASGFYESVLKEIESNHGLPDKELKTFLNVLYNTPFPKPNATIKIDLKEKLEEYSLKNCTDKQKRLSVDFLSPSKNVPELNSPDSGHFSISEHEIEFAHVRDNKRECMIEPLVLNKPAVNNNTQNKLTRSNSSPLLYRVVNSISELELKRSLDSRKDDRDLEVLVQTLSVSAIVKLFGSLLLERKVVIISESISKLSYCMEALQSIIYPFSWQHTLVSVIHDVNMLELLDCPTPYLLGILKETIDKDYHFDIDEAIVVDLDNRKQPIILAMGDEKTILPSHISKYIKQTLKSLKLHNSDISNMFILALANICTDYKKHLSKNNKTHFEKSEFIENHDKSMKLFLNWFTETAMFNAFIETYKTNENKSDMSIARSLFEMQSEQRKASLSKRFKQILKAI